MFTQDAGEAAGGAPWLVVGLTDVTPSKWCGCGRWALDSGVSEGGASQSMAGQW